MNMAEPAPTTSPHRDAIVQALTSYYNLLAEFPYLPQSAIQTPPPGGWGAEHRAVFERLGKSAAVVDVLCHIPYLASETFHINYDTSVIDWHGPRVQAVVTATPIGQGVSLQQAALEPMLQAIPENVISLTIPSNYGRWLLLDVVTGTITNYSVLGGPDPKCTDEERETGVAWKAHETKPVGELFDDWAEKLRSLWWAPLPAAAADRGEIRTPTTVDDPDQEEIRNIYRGHGWGTGDFRKEECKEALIAWSRQNFQKQQEQYSGAKANAKRRRERRAAE